MLKLFFYDYKHENIFKEIELGELTEHQIESIQKVFNAMLDLGMVDNRYVKPVIAESWKYVNYIDEDMEEVGSYIEFQGIIIMPIEKEYRNL